MQVSALKVMMSTGGSSKTIKKNSDVFSPSSSFPRFTRFHYILLDTGNLEKKFVFARFGNLVKKGFCFYY